MSDPYPLKGGHDYHLAEATRISEWDGKEHKHLGWHAGCEACDWFGPDRDTKTAAEDDCLAHDTTHNA
jgi:hypothetical protein